MLRTKNGAFRWALSFALAVGIRAEAASSRIRDDIDALPPAAATCPAGNDTYLIEGLPQQCLNTPWPSAVPDTDQIAETIAGDVEVPFLHVAQVTVTATLVPQDDTTPTTSRATAFSPAPLEPSVTITTDLLGDSTSEPVQQPTLTQSTGSDAEAESPLDNANFLSFEEWKKQNLAKVGQSADQVGTGRPGIGEGETRRRPGSINNALDSLGEDSEIEIDFGGFVSQPTIRRIEPTKQAGNVDEGSKEGDSSTFGGTRLGDPTRPHARGKDAGKTCKERSNYASFDCAATVLKTNPECKGSTSVLVENKDSYLLNECSAKNQFLIVELCNDILIDTIVLANFEFFSSMFRTFKVSVSDRYPVKLDKWRELGTFEARNSRQIQAFLVENPLIWARYLRIEFLTHFGNEYYCPISLLRVHGTTMMEEFNHDVKGARTEDDPEGDVEDAEKDDGKATDVVTAENLKSDWSIDSAKTPFFENTTSTQSSVGSSMPNPPIPEGPASCSAKPTAGSYASVDSLLRTQMDMMFSLNGSCPRVCKIGDGLGTPISASAPIAVTAMPTSTQQSQQTTATSSVAHTIMNNSQSRPDSTTPSSSSVVTAPTDPKSSIASSIRREQRSYVESSLNAVSSSSSYTKAPSSSSVQPPPSNPTTQESFFKSVHKRLQLLESNSTLSLQYIEEQSRILRDAFAKVEKRQLAKTSTFLETLNATVLSEMREFRDHYDQIWQSTVLELSSQRVQSQQEMVALSSRLTVLADEVVLQKRIAILQFLLILLCLGLVLFSRSSSSVSAYLELPPMVQHAFNKSSSSLAKYTPHFDTPPRSPSSTRPPSRYGFWSRGNPSHGRDPSDGSGISNDDGRKSPDIEYSPPTPTSQHSGEMDRPDGVDGGSDQEPPRNNLSDGWVRSNAAIPNGMKDDERRGAIEGPS